MTDTAQQPKAPAAKPTAERTPIAIDQLHFTTANPAGLKLPDGPEGKGEKVIARLFAGVYGDVKTEIEHRPWMRVFRVTRTKKVTRSGVGKDAKEIVEWVPLGKPFHIPDTCAVSVPTED
jgi:hypothetical protein